MDAFLHYDSEASCTSLSEGFHDGMSLRVSCPLEGAEEKLPLTGRQCLYWELIPLSVVAPRSNEGEKATAIIGFPGRGWACWILYWYDIEGREMVKW